MEINVNFKMYDYILEALIYVKPELLKKVLSVIGKQTQKEYNGFFPWRFTF